MKLWVDDGYGQWGVEEKNTNADSTCMGWDEDKEEDLLKYKRYKM